MSGAARVDAILALIDKVLGEVPESEKLSETSCKLPNIPVLSRA